MSKLDELLKGVDVEWKTLGDYTDYEQPTKYRVKSKEYHDDFDTPVLTAGKTFILGYTDETEGIYKGSEKSVIIFDDFTTANKWVDFDFKVKSSAMKLITSKDESKLLLRYIYHWMNTLSSDLVDGDHKRQWISNYANKKIPIPCPDNPEKSLKIQKEIVRILDTFTALTTELTTELTARKKQFEYYREQLLTFKDSEVKWKSLGEVVLKTSNIKWSDTDKTYRYIDLSSVCRDKNVITKTTEIRKKNAPSRAKKIVLQNDVIFATTRPTQMRLCLITEEYSNDIASTGYCVLSPDKKSVLPKWIFFCVSSNRFRNYVEENQSGSAYPAISDAKVKDFKIPIPPLEQQQRIVNILDKFDILTTSISEGLPKEIELRQKQYEYYRNKLLTFSKPS
ncbi:conserved hypothetical protein [Tenacibaculum maritimum]|uniref:restriction endonuclease subunit S n=1 Tax=Tenacibaculum maritimum TaxID=107401 RepID=UPI0012E501C3|nr:restriction endonuclease subunit S [Tenacibaculum maritimum]CAA0169590.1 conserved hypothetical protein [Tenacibaculum maritimum]